MNSLKQSWQGASQRFRVWIAALVRPGALQERNGLDDPSAAARSLERYSNAIFQSLALFRLCSYALGAALVFLLKQYGQPSVTEGVVVVVVGLYNTGRVLLRLNPEQFRRLVDRSSLGLDLLLGVTLVLWTGGLDSPFLIYSLASILTASLLMDIRTATGAAGVCALSIAGAYVASSLGLGGFSGILEGNYLAFTLLYAAVCYMAALLPFRTNRNWQRHVRTLAELSERQRLRRDVHDNVAQTLAFLSLKIKRAEERVSQDKSILTAQDVSEIAKSLEQGYLSVRDYLDSMGDGDTVGPLEASLATAVRKWSQDTGLPLKLNASGRDWGLPPAVRYQLLQIAREALANVAKHASPARVSVELEYRPTEVALMVRDDGKGFPPAQPRGHGLNIMHERAALIKATLTVSSAPERGTEVLVVYPYPDAASPDRKQPVGSPAP